MTVVPILSANLGDGEWGEGISITELGSIHCTVYAVYALEVLLDTSTLKYGLVSFLELRRGDKGGKKGCLPAPSGSTGDMRGVARGGTQVGGRRQCRQTAKPANLFTCTHQGIWTVPELTGLSGGGGGGRLHLHFVACKLGCNKWASIFLTVIP